MSLRAGCLFLRVKDEHRHGQGLVASLQLENESSQLQGETKDKSTLPWASHSCSTL